MSTPADRRAMSDVDIGCAAEVVAPGGPAANYYHRGATYLGGKFEISNFGQSI